MKAHERVTAAIRAANEAGRTGLVPFVTAGYPEPKDFISTLKSVAAVGDVVEVGIPFSDPMADGMTIQRSSFEALRKGVNLAWIFDELEKGGEYAAPLVMMSYLNPLLAFGYERLAKRAAETGVCGFIVPDLPFEESGEIRAALDVEGLALVQMVTPVTPPQRLAVLCEAARGFVYAVTMTGTTGKSVAVPDDVLAYMDRVRAVSPVPVCAGFGIRSAEQVSRMAGHVDGVVVGSALVEVLERGADPAAFLGELRGD